MKINNIQKIIISIVIPIITWFITYGLISEIYKHKYNRLDNNWWFWVIYFIIIGVFEFFWFRGSSNLEKKKFAGQIGEKNSTKEKSCDSIEEKIDQCKSYLTIRGQYVKLINNQRGKIREIIEAEQKNNLETEQNNNLEPKGNAFSLIKTMKGKSSLLLSSKGHKISQKRD